MKIIDGHLHIRPKTLLGKTDERFGVTVQSNGRWYVPKDDCMISVMPEYFETSSFTEDQVVQVMERYQVERAMIMQSICHYDNESVAEAVRKYPDRLRGAMVVIPGEKGSLDQIEYWAQQGLTAIKYEMNPRYGIPYAAPDFRFDSVQFDEICSIAEQYSLTIVIDPNKIGGPGYQSEEIRKSVKSHPAVRFVICHIGFPVYEFEKDPVKLEQWNQMTGNAKEENVWLDLAAIPDLYVEEGYPYPSALALIKTLKKRYGSSSMIWGSDIPGTYNTATYRQMKEMYEKSGLFKEKELSDIFYNNANLVYFGSI